MNKDKILLEFREPTPLGVYEIVDYNEELQSNMPPVFADSIDTDCTCKYHIACKVSLAQRKYKRKVLHSYTRRQYLFYIPLT
jgi:hypothetical protein